MPEWAKKMVGEVKADLRKKHPNWTEQHVENSAYAIVQSFGKEHHGKAPFTGD